MEIGEIGDRQMGRMKRLVLLITIAFVLFLIGCSGSGTIPAGSPSRSAPSDKSDAVSFDCATLEADIKTACGDDVADLGSNLEGTLPHVICSRTFSTGDPNTNPFVEVFLRTHADKASQDLLWRTKEGARDIAVGDDGGYFYTESNAYSDINYLVARKGLVTLQLKNVEWTRGTKPPAICTPEELEKLAATTIGRI